MAESLLEHDKNMSGSMNMWRELAYWLTLQSCSITVLCVIVNIYRKMGLSTDFVRTVAAFMKRIYPTCQLRITVAEECNHTYVYTTIIFSAVDYFHYYIRRANNLILPMKKLKRLANVPILG